MPTWLVTLGVVMVLGGLLLAFVLHVIADWSNFAAAVCAFWWPLVAVGVAFVAARDQTHAKVYAVVLGGFAVYNAMLEVSREEISQALNRDAASLVPAGETGPSHARTDIHRRLTRDAATYTDRAFRAKQRSRLWTLLGVTVGAVALVPKDTPSTGAFTAALLLLVGFFLLSTASDRPRRLDPTVERPIGLMRILGVCDVGLGVALALVTFL